MKTFSINHLRNAIGIDDAVFFNIFARLIQAIGGVLILFLIPLYLTPVEQGYYFTFISFASIQIFFELGFNTIITQFVAHETADISWENNKYTGNPNSISRLSSLLRFCAKWFMIASIFLFVALIIIGFLFLEKKETNNINWTSPWIIMSLSTALSLILSPIIAITEGLGMVLNSAQLKLKQYTIQYILIPIFLLINFKLYAYPSAQFISIIFALIFIFNSGIIKRIICIYKNKVTVRIDYKKEIFPLQLKTSITWIGGYFISQALIPIIFVKYGAVLAGKVGLTFSIISSIAIVSTSIINTKIPTFAKLIAKKDFLNLDDLFKKTFTQGISLLFLLLMLFVLSTIVLRHYNVAFMNKLLVSKQILLFSVTILFNQIVYYLATYLRSFKKEPFMIISLFIGLSSLGAIYLGNYLFKFDGLMYGYSLVMIFPNLLISIWQYKRKRTLYQSI